MAASPKSEVSTLADFEDFFSEHPPTASTANERNTLQTTVQPDPHSSTPSESDIKKRPVSSLEPAQTVSGNGNSADSINTVKQTEYNREFLNVATALANLKDELGQAGLLQKHSVKSNFLQVTEFIATRPKPASSSSLSPLVAQQFQSQRQQLATISTQLHRIKEVNYLLETVTEFTRDLLQVERVVIYRFTSPTEGEVVAESLQRGWTPTMGKTLEAVCFGEEYSENYVLQDGCIIPDVSKATLTPHQIQLLEKLQVKAFMAVPISIEGVWGLLVVQQCSKPRSWQENNISLLFHITRELALHLQRLKMTAQTQQQFEQATGLSKMMDRIRQSLDMDTLLSVTTQEAQRSLRADRVAIYRFTPDWSGEFIAETVVPGWKRLVGKDIKTVWEDTHLQETRGGRYRNHEPFAVNDIYTIGHSPCHVDILEQFEIRAYIVVPIFIRQELWGLLAAYQNSGSREWKATEISTLTQIGSQFGYTLQMAESLQTLALQDQRQQVVNNIIEQIRQARDLETIFTKTAREVRRFLKADRVGVFRFYPDSGYDDGEFVAEDVKGDYSSAIRAKIHDHCFGTQYADKYKEGRIQAVADIYTAGLSDCHIDILSQFQVRANLIVPLLKGSELWGLLCIHQCAEPREWQDVDIEFAQRIATQFTVAMQQAEYVDRLRKQTILLSETLEREKAVTKVIDRIRQTLTIDAILNVTVRELRQLLKADRVGVFRFYPDSGYDDGEFVSEDVKGEFASAIKAKIHDHCFGNQYADKYKDGRIQSVADIYNAGLSDCHIEVLSQFQVRANLIVPLLKGSELWGLLCIHQCAEPREWQDREIAFVQQIAAQFCVALQQAELLDNNRKQAEQILRASEVEKTISRVIDRIRQSLDIDSLFSASTQEVRLLLRADRVAVYRFNADWSGEFMAESVGSGWVRLVGKDIKTVWEDTYLQETQGGRYRKGEPSVIHDIYRAGHRQCHLDILEQFEVKAYTVVPIFVGQTLWGLLAAYQNSGPRQWEDADVRLLAQVGAQLGVGLQQVELVLQTQQQLTRERTLTKIVERIRQSLDLVRQSFDINTIFEVTTQEVRQLLKADRVALYQFEPDWSGSFISESVAAGWGKLVGTEVGTNVKDTKLQETQGGRYRRGESLAVNNIYEAGHSQCHVELLERFEAKAYVLVPVFVNQNLWGILCAYQNSGPRCWEESEVNLLNQIAVQFGIALEQAESVNKLRLSTEESASLAIREKASKELLQKRVIQLLGAVKPVFSGDLTVRVPVTEDEVGTIADAYNNTIQSLRKVVTQVQEATVQVTTTSQNNETAIVQLSQESQRQLQEVTQALRRIQAMVDSTQAVAASAQQVQSAVQQANQTVQQGDMAMNRTVDGIQTIRETVAETSRKIKRLSESSQKISKVVSLIGNFTTQTQLLALNASIEATRAGEYGRGFSVVADEVRSLSRQSADATREIEKLVQEIQSEITSVTGTMDQGIQQVVGGTTLVNETRQQLNAIVSATAQISQLVQGITQATEVQTQQSKLVTQSMADVAEIATKTSANSEQIAVSFQDLLATAQQLQASVGQFKVN